jgi:hypothetical protein
VGCVPPIKLICKLHDYNTVSVKRPKPLLQGIRPSDTTFTLAKNQQNPLSMFLYTSECYLLYSGHNLMCAEQYCPLVHIYMKYMDDKPATIELRVGNMYYIGHYCPDSQRNDNHINL